MKKNKFLKIFSYILIPILLLIIIISLFYEIGKEVYKEQNNYIEYFKSDTFLDLYMNELQRNARRLIYNNENFKNVYDGNVKICYTEEDQFQQIINKNMYNLKDYYFLIQYKDLALTNVELTSETNNIELIRGFIENGNKKSNIINGEIESDSELFLKKAIKYFDEFRNTYYSIERNKENISIIKGDDGSELWVTKEGTFSYNPYIDESDGLSLEEVEIIGEIEEKQWYTTTINDFKIYSSYSEEFVEPEYNYYLRQLIKDFQPYEKAMIYALPIASILLIGMIIYLLISIGHENCDGEINLNSFDRIQIEIVLSVGYTLIIGIGYSIIMFFYYMGNEYYNFVNSLVLTGYITIYVISMGMFITVIKRIKARTLIKDSLIGRFFIFCFKICKNVFKFLSKNLKQISSRANNSLNEISSKWSKISKVLIVFYLYIIICAILIWKLKFLGFIIVLFLSAVLLYFFVEYINCYDKIEKHLKEMYEGNNTKKLDEKAFNKAFRNVVKYINNISKGYEKAINEEIKSERLKTELITNVSHDIKTPLTSIINYIDLLKEEKIENEKAKEYIDILDNKSQRLKKITEDLIEASKASSGNVKLNIEKINVIELIKQSTGEFEDKFKQKELEIVSNFEEEEIYINADNRYMYRIIENLFSNISKYALDKSRVYIDVVKKENTVKIDIKNISKEKLNISSDELIQRFVRGDKSRTTEGSGLGLSISKSLTELQQGTFEIQIDGDLFKVVLEFNII